MSKTIRLVTTPATYTTTTVPSRRCTDFARGAELAEGSLGALDEHVARALTLNEMRGDSMKISSRFLTEATVEPQLADLFYEPIQKLQEETHASPSVISP